MPNQNLLADVLALEVELNDAQSQIHRARKHHFAKLPIVRSYLDRRQLAVDVQRIRINAAKKYLAPAE
jgi:hypothetical protein